MRTTLEIADDVMVAAKELAQAEGVSIGTMVSELARRGLAPARVRVSNGRPVIHSAPDAPPITPGMVRRGLDED